VQIQMEDALAPVSWCHLVQPAVQIRQDSSRGLWSDVAPDQRSQHGRPIQPLPHQIAALRGVDDRHGKALVGQYVITPASAVTSPPSR
jgi:hypothetical protein